MSIRLRDKILYMSFGAALVVLGMVLNSLGGKEADAQVGVQDVTFGTVTCRNIISTDFSIYDGAKLRGAFGLSINGNAMLTIYGDDYRKIVAYLGPNTTDGANNEMMLQLESRSKNDKREARMSIDGNGGRFDCFNKIGEEVATLAIGTKGNSVLTRTDKWGYEK